MKNAARARRPPRCVPLTLLGVAQLLLAASLFSCHLPAGLIVPEQAIEVLETRARGPLPPEDELARRIAERLGHPTRARRLRRSHAFRVDLGLGPLDLGTRSAEVSLGPALGGLRTGDIVLAKNANPQSLGSTLSLARFTFFDHAGVLVLEDDGAFVYESRPSLSFHPSAPDFASRFRGGARRTPLVEFLRRYETLEFVRLARAEATDWRGELVRRAAESLAEGIRFDPHHDPDDPRLSCTEYIQHLLDGIPGDPVRLEPVPIAGSASLLRLLRSLGFRTLGYVVPDSFETLPGARRVGVLAFHRTQLEVDAVRIAYRLLFEDFQARGMDAQIGDTLAFDRWHFMRYRRSTELFLETAVDLAMRRADGRRVEGGDRAPAEELEEELRTVLPVLFPPGP